ncbi:MAG: hypothetical protein HY812_09500 [Planctomycetes bacterium]|nr:hypothetical protein [Planctomycetota bacterium]
MRVPRWRLLVSYMRLREDRDLGNVMDTAVKGALAELGRSLPGGRLDRCPAVTALRQSLCSLGIDLDGATPCSEQLLAALLASPQAARGCLAWEFLNILTIRSLAPWSVLDRTRLAPPLEFRAGRAGDRLLTPKDDSEGLPLLADSTGVIASPWTCPAPQELEGLKEPVFVCYLPEDLFRVVEPKSHMGKLVWLTWAYRFVQQRTCSFQQVNS